MRKTFLLALFLLPSFALLAQNRFAQFYSTPLLYNPANTGRFNKSTRLIAGFHNDKNTNGLHNQSYLSVDTKILGAAVGENNCFAIGFSGLAEQSMGVGMKNSYLSVSLAYHKGLNEEGTQQIGVGFQTVFAHRTLNPPSVFFESHLASWINSGYANIDAFNFNKIDFTYFDLNAGLSYQGQFNAKNFFSTGISINHINQPSKIFQGGEFSLSRQYWGHLGWEANLPLERKFYSAVLASYSKNVVDDILVGSVYQMLVKKQTRIHIGGWYRDNKLLGTSIIPTLGLHYFDFGITYSYDINVSRKNSGQQNANEITLNYTTAKSRARFYEKKFITY